MRHNIFVQLHGHTVACITIAILIASVLVVQSSGLIEADSIQADPVPRKASGEVQTTYKDPLYGYSIRLPENWYVSPTSPTALYGATTFFNYDPDLAERAGTLPPGAMRMQLSLAPLAPGQQFADWLAKWIDFEINRPQIKDYDLRVVGLEYIRVGKFLGARYTIAGVDHPTVVELSLKMDDHRIVVAGVYSDDLTNDLPKAMALLEELQIDSSYGFSPEVLQISEQWSQEPQPALPQERTAPPEGPSSTCPAGTFPGTEAPESPIVLYMPFQSGETWTVGGSGSFYGNNYHCNSYNDYYSTDWNRSGDDGATVLPVADGVISNAASPACPVTGYGCYVQIDHVSGIRTLYGHLSSVARSSGSVTHSDLIGTVGSTGNSTSSHLHLSFRQSNGSYYSHCYNNGQQCPNQEAGQAPQSPKPSPMNTANGARSLVDGQSYTSNNSQSTGGSGNDTVLWDFDPNSAGWSASGMEWQGFGYGTWIMDPAQGTDPWIVKDDLYYDNSRYWGVEIRMSSRADIGDNIFWKTTNEPFYSGDKSVVLRVIPDGATRTITIRTNDNPKWMHFISGLRIDPAYDGRPGTAGSNDDNILIDWVKLLNDPECPTVSITSPAEGSYFNGNVAISATASDGGGGETPSGVNRVAWDAWYDGSWNHSSSVSPNPDTSSPYNATLTVPSGLADQWVNIVAMAWDNQGNECMENRAYRGVYIDRTAPTNPTAVSPGCTATSNVWQNTCSNANFTWSGATDAGSGIAGYYYYWGTSGTADPATWTTAAAYDPASIPSGDTYYLRVKTQDNAGNVSSPATLFVLKYDGTAPTNPALVTPGCTATSNVWQNTCSDANFTWSGASDGSSGVAGYYYYWGTSSTADPITWTTSAAFNPPAIASGNTYHLRVKTQDNAGNTSGAITLFVLRYDGTAPANPTAVSPGCTATSNVWQNICSDVSLTWSGASDGSSGVAGYYYYWGTSSNADPITWTTSAAYNPPAIASGTTYFLRVKTQDNAGNTSSPVTLFILRYDGLPPISRASSPPVALILPIPIDWTANDPEPGAGLSSTALWFKYEASGNWIDSGLSATGTAGTFSFTPANGYGTYFFATVCSDMAGNSESAPSGQGDTQTIFDAPTSTPTPTSTPYPTATPTPTATATTPPSTMPSLSIPQNVPGYPYQNVIMPIQFTGNGNSIASLVFSVDYDQTCLQFDPTDADGDGIPDAVTFSIPPGYAASVAFDANNTAGELAFFIYDPLPPLTPVPNSTLASIRLRVVCQPTSGTPIVSRVGFASEPTASFGTTTGTSVPGVTADGSVAIQAVRAGDCNADLSVNAGDISALVLEIFDGDGTNPAAAPGGTFPGSSVGCNANRDAAIDAGDISCTVLIIFSGPAACAPPLAPEGTGPQPLRGLPPSLRLANPTVQEALLTLPVVFDPGDGQISSIVFSLAYDASLLELDPTDKDGNGLPDVISLDLPPGYAGSAIVDQGQGRLHILVADPLAPLSALANGKLLAVTWHLNSRESAGVAAKSIVFASEQLPSFGDTLGRSVQGFSAR